jgi:periplasmic divalent cation tolerance protein
VKTRTKATAGFSIALVTAPDLKTARKLAKIILQQQLAACANLVPKIESHYWWRGKLERSNEVLIVLKTKKSHLRALEKCVLQNHPYDTPEFLALKIDSGANRYLDWIAASVK